MMNEVKRIVDRKNECNRAYIHIRPSAQTIQKESLTESTKWQMRHKAYKVGACNGKEQDRRCDDKKTL